MPRIGRVFNPGVHFAKNSKHGCGNCRGCGKHLVMGQAVTGSSNVFINGFPVVREGDSGIHDEATCCSGGVWEAFKVVTHNTVYINNRLAFCHGDITRHDGTDYGKFIVKDCFVGTGMGDSSTDDA